MTWTDLLLRMRAMVLHRRVERELDEEVEFHLAMARRKLAQAGHSADEAARLARLNFGRTVIAKEDCHSVRGIQPLENALQDVRYALRSFRRSPGFVVTVAATIALGLGLNAALFTLFNAYVLRPIAVRDPHSLYSFTWTNRSGLAHAFSWPEYRRLTEDNSAFSEAAADEFLFSRLYGRPFLGQLVTGNYFQMLGVGPVLGRTLLPEDTAVPGRDPVIVLSHATWQNVFGGRTDIIGMKITLRGYPMEVIGVARQGFQGLGDVPRDFWAPLTMAGRLQDGADLFGAEHPERLEIIGRIKPGQSVSGSEAALAAWSRRDTAQLPVEKRAAGILLHSKATAIPLTPELLLLFTPLAAAFALVLLLACTNVANMMLARAMARQKEIGIRLSLGAARGRLVRQLLTESILLSIPAALAGFAVSRFTIDGSLRAMFATIPGDMLELIRLSPLPLDWRVLGFMFSAALVSAFLFGLVPAIQATRGDVMLAARGEFTADHRPARFRNGLVIAQVAACTLLLVACGALVRTTLTMSTFDIGFNTRHVIALNLVEKGRARALAALTANMGVDTIAAASSVPLGGLVPAVTASRQSELAISAAYNYVSPAYFGMLGIPVVSGRNFTAEEANSGRGVAILSAATAQRLFPNADALGQVIHMAGKPGGDVRIIGVAGDIVTCSIAYGKDPTLIYLPTTPATAERSLLVSVRGDVEAAKRRLDSQLRTLAPDAVEDIHSLDQYLAVGIYPFRAASLIGFALGGLALLLTVSGIYGLLAYLVTQRTKEIGIRVALGATSRSVTGMMLNQCLRLAAIGVLVGGLIAVGVSRMLASQFVFMRVFDFPAFGAGVTMVVVAAIGAGYVPSRRAARVDPIRTLRCD